MNPPPTPSAMNAKPHAHLKTIVFAGQLLPAWAQLLDLAARLCPISRDSRDWFCRLTSGNGVEDSRVIHRHCASLRASLQQHRTTITGDLRRNPADAQPRQIIDAWLYALDTMILEAADQKTCSWTIEGVADTAIDEGGGDITLRRV